MRLLLLIVLAVTSTLLTGCATVSGTATQPISIQAVDERGRIIEGMSCRVANGSAQYLGDTPMFDLKVRRSSTPLLVECRAEGLPMARAVVISRADTSNAVQMLLPGGTSMMMLDHMTGYMYSYPRWIRLQAGADMVFDKRDERGRNPTPGTITRSFDAAVRYASGASTATD